jgi:crossover junction endodeoxyribonuclease RuvC
VPSPPPPLRVLGVDPGTRVVGWGVVEAHGSRYRAVGHGVLEAPRGRPVAERLAQLATGLAEVVKAHAPREAAIEEAFHGRDASAALRIGEARGALVVVLVQAGLGVVGYANNVVKKAVTGAGRASKEQVQAMVRRVLGLDTAPTPFDAADALAVAICHLQRRADPAAAGGGLPARTREALRRAGVSPPRRRR